MHSYAHTCQNSKKNHKLFLFQCISISSHLQKQKLFPGAQKKNPGERVDLEENLELYGTQKFGLFFGSSFW